MNKLVLRRAKALLLFAFFVVSVSSCVNDDYDLSEDNLNLEITPFEGGLTLPLGKTDRIELQNLLKDVDADILTVDGNGEYSIVYNDSFTVSDDLSDFTDMIHLPGINYNDAISFQFANPQTRSMGNLETQISEELDIDFLSDGDISDFVASVGVVELEDAYLYVTFDGSELNLAANSSLAFDFDLMIPDILKVSSADNDGTVHLTGVVKENEDYEIAIPLESIDLTGVDFKAGVRTAIKFFGTVKLTTSTENIAQWIGMKHSLGYSIVLPDATKISRLTCKLDYTIDPVYQTVDLSDVKSFFDDLGSDTNLDLNSILLALNVNTNIGAPIDAGIEVVPYYNGAADKAKSMTANMTIKASDSADKTVVTNYVFNEDELLALLEGVPEKLELIIVAKTNPAAESVIEPGADYSISADYDFELPLEFGENFTITYRDTIPDIAPILGSILSKGNKVKLAGVVENSLPLGLDLKLNFLDSNDRPVPAVENTGVQSIAPCDMNGNAVKTDLDILVALKDGVRAEDIASLELVFAAGSKGVAGVQAAKDDYLQAVFQLVLPEGATFDINDLINDEK